MCAYYFLTVSRCRLLPSLSILQQTPVHSQLQPMSLLIQVNTRQAYGEGMSEMNSDTPWGFK